MEKLPHRADVKLIKPDEVKIEDINRKEDRPRINIAPYENSIARYIPWIKDAILESPDKKIRVRTKDIAKAMGEDFEEKEAYEIYWGLKYVLFLDGIVVESGKKIPEGEHLLIMRFATKDDVISEFEIVKNL